MFDAPWLSVEVDVGSVLVFALSPDVVFELLKLSEEVEEVLVFP